MYDSRDLWLLIDSVVPNLFTCDCTSGVSDTLYHSADTIVEAVRQWNKEKNIT